MAKIEVIVDEVFPVFSCAEKIKEGNELFQLDIPDEMYREYCYIMYRYHEFQLKLQILYEHGNNKLAEKCCGYRVPEGSSVDTEYKLNKIRDEVAKEPV